MEILLNSPCGASEDKTHVVAVLLCGVCADWRVDLCFEGFIYCLSWEIMQIELILNLLKFIDGFCL